MKLVCDTCGAKYRVDREKVRGRGVQFQCKTCHKQIVVARTQVGGDAAQSGEPAGVAELPSADLRVTSAESGAPEPPRSIEIEFTDSIELEVPGTIGGASEESGEGWYVAILDGEALGPYETREVIDRLGSGRLDRQAFGWREGFDEWTRLRDVPEFHETILEAERAAGRDEEHLEVSPDTLPPLPARAIAALRLARGLSAKGPQPRGKADRYLELELVAETALTRIYAGRDREGQPALITQLAPGHRGDQEALARFDGLPLLVERLQGCRGVLPIIDRGSPLLGDPYFAQRLPPGYWLAERLRPGHPASLSALEWLGVIDGCLEVLGDWHRAGMVCGELRPEHLRVTSAPGSVNARVSVTGLERARCIDGEDNRPGARLARYSPYLAPELARGQPASPASDLFSLGVIAYELLGGQRPYEASSRAGVACLAVEDRRPLPRSAQVPALIEELVASLLDPEADRRPRGAAEVQEALRRFLELQAWMTRPAMAELPEEEPVTINVRR